MIVLVEKYKVTVTKEQGDPVFRGGGWANARGVGTLPESTFLYHVKKELQKQGYNCIKKRMWKDGHMVDDTQQYIRDRWGRWCIYNDHYAVYDAGEYFNEHGIVYLTYTIL